MPSLKPLNDRVIVKPLIEEHTTKGGIILPETVDKERPEKGTVIAVGPGKLLDNGQRGVLNVVVGNTVIFKKYSPDEVKVGDEEYLVLSESDILAIIEE